ncbi:hypothetical protein FRC03_012961 [Tulasnella sp. 419]|nr:hypothetical protein FRC02_001150 [Tulasnella sp. 418]KAG8950083.1 hypothetical protein FRC03_012961 [Tulasnella sp. 419]
MASSTRFISHAHARSNSSKFSHIPPSISWGYTKEPSIQLHRPVWEIDPSSSSCTITGEVELDVSLFTKNAVGCLDYSIGISLSRPEEDDERIDWNQDGPGNYYRTRSNIHIHPRLVVDNTCYVKFTIRLPSSVLSSAPGQIYSVGVKAYALDDPFVTTTPATVSFMVLQPSKTFARRDSSYKGRSRSATVMMEGRRGSLITMVA